MGLRVGAEGSACGLGGEGTVDILAWSARKGDWWDSVLIGVQFGYTKCSSHICLYSSRYISFSWGGP